MPHEPVPPEPRWRMPHPSMVVRGLGLAAFSVAAGWLAVGAAQRSWLLVPVTALSGIASILALWAAAIHLTGGEKFDDHPFV